MSANGQLVFTDVDKVTFKGVGNASNAVIDTLTGKIGVGVDSPSANLHVVGNCFVSTNFELGGTMTMGTVTVEAQHELSAITATGNLTPHTIQFTNPTTAFTTTGNVSVGKDLTVTGFVGNSGTGAILVPSGTTAQQPAGVNGMLRYNTETGYMEAYTVSGWSVIATPPSITSFDITNVAVAAVNTDTITVSGSGFDAITNIQLRGADGKNYDTTTFTFTNSGSIGFKIGTLATGQLANRPYKVVATNGAGLSATSSTTLGLGGVTWSLPAASSINEFAIGAATTLTLSAFDGAGGSAVTYTLQSGSYLSGTFTLSGSTITGTTNAAENTTSSVTIRATDNADSSVFLDRTFTLKAAPDALYPFSSAFTFTNAGATGRYGPTLTDLTTAYSPDWTDYTSNLNVTTQGIQEWTVPKTGTYEIEVYGARGRGAYGNYDTGYYGKGARMKGQFSLTKSQIVKIVVGQEGVLGTATEFNGGGGGGGGSFVFTGTTPLIIAGGGGGGAIVNVSGTNLLSECIAIGGQITTTATLFNYDSSKSGTYGSWYVADNGANGGHWNSNSAGGYSNNATVSQTATTGSAGRGWTDMIASMNFDAGARASVAVRWYNPGGGAIHGGFGGGNHSGNHPGGGGGGYSGGASARYQVFPNLYRTGGGGGGSYNNGSNQSNSPGVRDGHGQVIINLL